jgi:hypothetical protein
VAAWTSCKGTALRPATLTNSFIFSASIVGNFSFQARDENSFWSVILLLFEKDLFDSSLLEFVHFQSLSSPVIAEFVITGFKFVGEWNASVWERICECPIQMLQR